MSDDIFDPVQCTEAGHSGVDRWNTLINEIAATHGVPPNLCKAHILYESGGNPSIVSFDQGCGLGQITSGVTRVNGVYLYEGRDILDPRYNIEIMCREFIASNIAAFPGNLRAVIAAYNAGQGAVRRAILNGDDPASACYWIDGAGTRHYNYYVEKVEPAYSWFNATSHEVLGK